MPIVLVHISIVSVLLILRMQKLSLSLRFQPINILRFNFTFPISYVRQVLKRYTLISPRNMLLVTTTRSFSCLTFQYPDCYRSQQAYLKTMTALQADLSAKDMKLQIFSPYPHIMCKYEEVLL